MPKPLMQAMMLADHVYRDGPTGKCIIAGTFSTYTIRPRKLSLELPPGVPPLKTEIEGEHRFVTGPVTKPGSPYLYVALSEVHGTVPLRIRYVSLADASVLMEVHIGVTSSDPIAVAEYIFDMPPIDVIHGGSLQPGVYSFDLLYEDEILGSWRVTIRKGEENEEHQP